MNSTKFLKDFAKHFSDSLPPSLKHLHQEFESQFCQGLQLAFEKMNLVTREEFEIQTKLLARTRDKVTELERKLEILEQRK